MSRDERVSPPASAHGHARALQVGEPEGGETRLGCLDGESAVAAAGHDGEGLEQGPEEEALVDRAHGPLLAAQLFSEQRGGVALQAVAITHHARQTREGGVLGRHGMDLLLVDQLQAVFDGPQEPI